MQSNSHSYSHRFLPYFPQPPLLFLNSLAPTHFLFLNSLAFTGSLFVRAELRIYKLFYYQVPMSLSPATECPVPARHSQYEAREQYGPREWCTSTEAEGVWYRRGECVGPRALDPRPAPGHSLSLSLTRFCLGV
eukprot:45880-Rhodomonas_salina.1